MATLSVRIPDEIKTELDDFAKQEKLEQSSEAARKLLAIGLETWHKERALELLRKGKISFLKAAEVAKIDVWELATLVKEEGAMWIKDKEKIKKDVIGS